MQGRPRKRFGERLRVTTIGLPAKVDDELRDLADRTGRTLAAIVRQAVERHLPDLEREAREGELRQQEETRAG